MHHLSQAAEHLLGTAQHRRRQKQVPTLPQACLAEFHFPPQTPPQLWRLQRGCFMRAQRASYPSFSVPVHSALKAAPNPYFADFQKQLTDQKVRFEQFARVAQSELRHAASDIAEVFCASFQI